MATAPLRSGFAEISSSRRVLGCAAADFEYRAMIGQDAFHGLGDRALVAFGRGADRALVRRDVEFLVPQIGFSALLMVRRMSVPKSSTPLNLE